MDPQHLKVEKQNQELKKSEQNIYTHSIYCKIYPYESESNQIYIRSQRTFKEFKSALELGGLTKTKIG